MILGMRAMRVILPEFLTVVPQARRFERARQALRPAA
jgi:hypothetical protein